MAERAAPRAILVLGSHRSGTSALTRVLNLLGVDLGPNLMEPEPGDNSLGFWEPRDIVDLHDGLLRALGSAWFDTTPLPPQWWRRPEVAPFRDELARLLAERFADSPLWAVKDPRLCRLLPLWRPLLREMGVEPACVLIGRNPLEVAGSLARRNELPRAQAQLLWLDHCLEAELHSRDLRRVFVTYDQVMADWRGTVRRVARTLELGWPRRLREIASDVDAFLRPELRSQRVPDELLDEEPDLATWVPELHRAWTRAAERGDSPALRRRLSSLRSRISTALQLYEPQVSRLKGEAALLRAGLDAQGVERAAAEARLADQRGQIEGLLASVEGYRAELARTQRVLQDDQARAREALGRSAAELAEARDALDAGERRYQAELARARSSLEENQRALEAELADARGALQAELAEVRGGLEAYRAELERTQARLAVEQGESVRLRAALEVEDAEQSRLRDALVAADRHATEVHAGAEAARAELDEARRALTEDRAAIVTLRGALEASRAEVRTLYASASWRLTRPLRAIWDFSAGVLPFAREMRGFPRRARYTLQSRGAAALLSDITGELAARLRRGTLAPPRSALPPPARVELPAAAADAERPALHFPEAAAPVASLVIPVYDGFAHTYACLASVLERTRGVPYEVIVVDDGSADETRELAQIARGIRVLRNEQNQGFVETCNRGAAAARGEFVVFLNNDTQVTEGWLESLLAPFAEADDVGLVGAKLVYPDGRLQEAGGLIFRDASGWNYGRGDDPRDPRYEFTRETDYCSGACLAIPRALFAELSGFDRRYAPAYYEDVDLAFAVRAAGRRVLYQPAAEVIHVEGATSGTDTSTGPKSFQRVNRGKLAEKWAEALASQPPPEDGPEPARARDRGPQVLVVDSYTPRPDRDAGSLRMRNLLRILRRLGCPVTFVPENRAHDGDYTRALQALGVEPLYHPYLPSLEAHLEAAGARYAWVVLSRVEVAARALDAVREHCPQARVVFDTVDLHFLRESRRANLPGGADAAAVERSRREELAVARGCDLTLVVSPAEKDLLAREAPDVRVEVVSTIHEPDPTEPPFAERNGLLFIANFHHPPNCDALEYYLSEVQPRVRERLPGAPLTVIGAHAPRSLEALAGPEVHFAGYVPDIRPLFAGARLSVAPLRYGAGIKGKINTSMGYGVPVVTTGIGAEGMDLKHGEDALIADTPDAFAEAVVAAHSDAELWGRLRENGLASVSTGFSFERAEATLARLLGLAP